MALPITVTRPTSSDHWLRGNSYVIRWEDGDTATYPTVRLILYKGTASISQIAYANNSASAYTWSITNSLAVGTDYRIFASETNI